MALTAKVHQVGFEPTHPKIFELESNPLDRSGIDACDGNRSQNIKSLTFSAKEGIFKNNSCQFLLRFLLLRFGCVYGFSRIHHWLSGFGFRRSFIVTFWRTPIDTRSRKQVSSAVLNSFGYNFFRWLCLFN